MADVENTPGASVSLEEDTRTRKTVRLRTLTPKVTGPVLDDVPVEAAGDDVEDTRTRMTVKLKPSAAKPPLTLKKPAADGAVAAEAGAEGEGHTVRLPRPSLKKGPGAAAPGMPPQGGPRPVRRPEMNGAPVKENYPADVPLDVPRASGFYMVMTLISLLFLIGTAALTTVHYLNFEHLIEFEIPGIPFGK